MDLAYFGMEKFYNALQRFFKDLNIPVNYFTQEPTAAEELLENTYKPNNPAHQLMGDIYFLGMVDDAAFENSKSEKDLEGIKKERKDYDGILIFGVELNKRENNLLPTRTQFAEITRAFNREYHYTPVVVVFKYDKYISFASAQRIKYSQEWREGEKAGKVSLLKDIDFSDTHTGHLKILQSLAIERAGKNAVNSFAKLYEYWQKVFSVSILNKQFYSELVDWYSWAVNNVAFPQIRPEKDLIPDKSHQSESVIRLLTRLIFCWFMKEKGAKEKGMINPELFDVNKLKNILKDFEGKNGRETIYYKAILQNLFFATLNKPINQRKVIDKGFNPKEYGDPLVYRFDELFQIPKTFLKHFENIPFLNGGLFDCLDQRKDKDNPIEIRLDGFSTKEKNQARVPDFLFWGEHKGINLSEEKKNETVHGIIDILNSYKFTIEENTPIEKEIALDPELLGRVFENLLASYNPETKTTARKATGSYYTPREIVDYMVDESLIASLKQKLNDAGITENVEQRLRELISYDKTENPFTEKETMVIIQALENLKVFDPACGSGAFPMGMLHKLVWILNKVDPENKRWFETIINRLPEYIRAKMRKKLEGENWDYLRKLGIVQQSIYGVDIQPIAIQIAKLRFFISLLVDQDIKGNAQNNFGLMPLPNLDFKLVAANTLIGAPEQNQYTDWLIQDEFFDKFNVITEKYFTTYEPKEKKKLIEEIKRLVNSRVQKKLDEINRLSTHEDERFSKHLAEKNKAVIEQKKNDTRLWESYNNLFKHESVGFFDIKYFFPEVKDGFDVVIANPPYVQIQKFSGKQEQKDWEKQKYETYTKMGDIYCLFYEKGNQLLRKYGVLTFITSNKWMRANYGKATRKYFVENTNPLQIIDFGGYKVFESATVDTNILILEKVAQASSLRDHKQDACATACSIGKDFTENTDIAEYLSAKAITLNNLSEKSWIIASKDEQKTREKIEKIGTPLKKWDISINYGIKTGFNEAFIIDGKKKDELIARDPKNAEIIKPILRGRDIKRYKAEFADLWLINTHNGYNSVAPTNIQDYPMIKQHLDSYWEKLEKRQDKGITPYNLRNCTYFLEFKEPKIIYPETTVRRNEFSLDADGMYLDKTCFMITGENLHYLNAVLASKLMEWYLESELRLLGKKSIQYSKQYIENIPIPEIFKKDQQPFITLVNQILSLKKSDPNADTSALEAEIDRLVYELYGLTEEEIAIMEENVKR